MHCDDPNCAAGGNSRHFPTNSNTGQYSSLALDSAGFPVVSYYDAANADLKVMHCDDTDCAGGAESITSPDTSDDVGRFTSLVLDSSGNPVVAYLDLVGNALHLNILHCNDPDCDGTGEAISSPDLDNTAGSHTSLALDGSGNPVVSYRRSGVDDLKLLHCDDPNCGGVLGSESVTVPDHGGFPGLYTSLELDTTGAPVISHYDSDRRNLGIARCTAANCFTVSRTLPDNSVDVGQFTSLTFGFFNYPIVSYYDAANGDLKVMHCNDTACDGADESITSPDTVGDVGKFTSVARDLSSRPIVSYFDDTTNDLKVLTCDDLNCAGNESGNIVSADTVGIVGRYTSMTTAGCCFPVVSYYDLSSNEPKVLKCDILFGCSGTNTVESPDTSFFAGGTHSSIILDASGFPVMSYYCGIGGNLCVLHCDDASCAGDESGNIETPDIVPAQFTSIELDSSGNPVISYYDSLAGDLKVLHCDDPNCAGDESGNIVTPDSVGDVGSYTSLELNASGNPVISYHDATNGYLKLLTCGDPLCQGKSPDKDGDGCSDQAEQQTAAGSETTGGLRDPNNPWDFFDVNGDKHIDVPNDILPVILAYLQGPNDPGGPGPNYTAAEDRGLAKKGAQFAWQRTGPDGSIDVPNDILPIILQYLHSCK